MFIAGYLHIHVYHIIASLWCGLVEVVPRATFTLLTHLQHMTMYLEYAAVLSRVTPSSNMVGCGAKTKDLRKHQHGLHMYMIAVLLRLTRKKCKWCMPVFAEAVLHLELSAVLKVTTDSHFTISLNLGSIVSSASSIYILYIRRTASITISQRCRGINGMRAIHAAAVIACMLCCNSGWALDANLS